MAHMNFSVWEESAFSGHPNHHGHEMLDLEPKERKIDQKNKKHKKLKSVILPLI